MWVLAFIVLVILAIVSISVLSARQFNDAWPPIDEDEFFKRCTPGTNRETALTVRKIIAEQLGIPYAQIYPEQRFVEDLNAD